MLLPPDPRGAVRGREPVLGESCVTRATLALCDRSLPRSSSCGRTSSGVGSVFISQSGLKLRPEFAEWDAESALRGAGVRVADPKACQCGEVLKGVNKPWECKVFGTACTPETPIGTCMVSSEGACAAIYNFGRLHQQP